MNRVHIRGKANMPWNILIDTHRHFRTDFGISRCVGFVGTLKVFFCDANFDIRAESWLVNKHFTRPQNHRQVS